MSELPPWIVSSKDGALVAVYVQPKAAKDALVGVHGPALKLKVKAPPVEGRANLAVEHFVADLLGVAASDVSVVSGGRSRHKRVAVAGKAAREVACAIESVLSSRAHEPGKEVNGQENGGQEDA
jgi:uncharacterized protein